MNKKHNAIKDKSLQFAIEIVNLYKYLCDNKKEFVLNKQLFRSGASKSPTFHIQTISNK